MTTDLTPTSHRRTRWFGDDWPFTAFLGHLPTLEAPMRIEERMERSGDTETYVVRAEAPGIDPDRDVEIRFMNGKLLLCVERRESSATEGEGLMRSEFRYGSFRRTLSVPMSVQPGEVSASYQDGILEVRVPMPTTPLPASKVTVTRPDP